MKSFSKYLKENAEQKKYCFKIKVAGDLPENCEDVMETCLQQFQVSKFTKGKSSPIQATLLDFPTITNSCITVFETELDYPTTSHVLMNLLANATGIPLNAIRVRTPLEEADAEIERENMIDAGKTNKALLSQDYEKDSNQDLVGEKYVSSFLKDIAKANKDAQPMQVKDVNAQLLAKTLHKEKQESMPKVGPATSLFGSKGK